MPNRTDFAHIQGGGGSRLEAGVLARGVLRPVRGHDSELSAPKRRSQHFQFAE